jgi:hypothetical protein
MPSIYLYVGVWCLSVWYVCLIYPSIWLLLCYLQALNWGSCPPHKAGWHSGGRTWRQYHYCVPQIWMPRRRRMLSAQTRSSPPLFVHPWYILNEKKHISLGIAHWQEQNKSTKADLEQHFRKLGRNPAGGSQRIWIESPNTLAKSLIVFICSTSFVHKEVCQFLSKGRGLQLSSQIQPKSIWFTYQRCSGCATS